MDKLINIIKPGEPVPSLDGKINTYGTDLYEMQNIEGGMYRLFKSQYEDRIAKVRMKRTTPVRNRSIDKRKYSKLRKGHHDYWEFIRYLSRNGRVCGFQCTKDKEEQLKIDYFNATGEELKDDQYNSDLSPDTWGNAMRISFPKPNDLSIEEINSLLPGDVEAKKWVENTSELVVSRMQLVRELLYMGFRHGKEHKLEEIESTIKKFQHTD